MRTTRRSVAARRWPRWTWPIYIVLFGLSIPWYVTPTEEPALWLGLPFWVVLSLAASLGVALYTAWLLAHHWPGGELSEVGDVHEEGE